MKLSFSVLLLLICAAGISVGQKKVKNNSSNTLLATQLKPEGRYVINANKQLELISSAVHFGFSFTGSKCALYVSLPNANSHNYLQYTLDGVYQKRIRIDGSAAQPLVIEAPAGGLHKVWIYKATEAHTGAILISRVTAPNIKPLALPKAALIEFIGNSITCGAAADTSDVPCGQGEYHDHHNAYMAYGPRVARALGVNFVLSSVSGIGIYRTWNMDGPSMPQVYEKADFQEKNRQLWNFKLFTPQVVSIALGTNDLSNGDGKTPRKPFDADTFISNFVQFVQTVKAKYPHASIALLSSPMVKGEARTKLENCLTAIKQKVDALYPSAQPVATFFFEPMEARGCSGHPSVEDHAILAQQLQPFFNKLLK